METVAEVSKVNNDNPLISVIVPAFNIEIYLSECLDSIINQTYSMIEIVVVDDGSIDNTGKIAEEYQAMCPDRVICIHQVNAGVLKARLAGLEASHGEWIGFVDGDDLIESNMYERLLSNAIFHQIRPQM